MKTITNRQIIHHNQIISVVGTYAGFLLEFVRNFYEIIYFIGISIKNKFIFLGLSIIRTRFCWLY